MLVALLTGCTPADRTDTAASEATGTQSGSPATFSSDAAADDAARVDDAVARAAWQLRRTSSGESIAEHQPEQLERQVLPGSVFKVVTALAALEQGRADLRLICSRRLTVDGRVLDCVHPIRPHAIDLERALADSCNTFFVTLAARLDRSAWQRTATRLGVPAIAEPSPVGLLAVGLAGPRASARVWRDVVLRAVAASDVPLAHRQVLRNGLRLAASEGSAEVLADPWAETLAKTGTVVEAGASEGLAVVLRPEADLDVVVRVRGGAGRDAAAVAAAVLARAGPDSTVVRVGLTRQRRPDTATSASGDEDAVGTRVIDVDLESYVARVVAAEATPAMAPPVLDALAIAVRSYGGAHPGRHASEGFDVCDTTHCQVVAPTAWPAARAAAGRTRTLVLAAAGQLMPVHYSAACAGRLYSATSTWGRPTDVEGRVGPDPHAHPVPAWSAEVTVRELSDALASAGFKGNGLRDLHINGNGRGRGRGARREDEMVRPTSVDLEGLVPASVSADRFRTIVGRSLGWHVLKSHDWTVTRTSAGFRFDGRGKGHGVGLCLAGAQAMVVAARAPVTASDILAAYYPALTLQSTADRIRLRLPHGAQALAPRLLGGIYAATASLRRALQVSAPRAFDIVVHPTIEAYQRATGRAWWTGGSTRVGPGNRARIDLPPLDVLEREGRLEARLRHELTHALTGATLAEAPLSRQEGLAALQSGTFAASELEELTGPCPDEDAVARPGSADAMRTLYRQAAACVARALADGTTWRDLARR